MAAIGLAAVVVTWPLLANPRALPPRNDYFGTDLFNYYSTAGAAYTTVVRFHQFPLRSPWHSGGHPLHAYPEDKTFTPTMLLILAMGPWAALKIEIVLLTVASGIGMYVLTRRAMGYGVAGALLSGMSFALGGFLMARWMRGWLGTTHVVLLPWVLYALWRGRRRPWWLAVAAGIVAWLLVAHKYVALSMGWFLLMVGLLQLDEADAKKGSDPLDAGGLLPFPRPTWGYFGRLVGVWVFAVGLAAVKLIPMCGFVRGYLEDRPFPLAGQWWTIVGWAIILAWLGLIPSVSRWLRTRRTRVRGVVVIVVASLVVVVAVGPWMRRPQFQGQVPRRWVRHNLECLTGYGDWRMSDSGVRTPVARDSYRARAPVGLPVLLLAVAALIRRRPGTWRWGILAALFFAMDLTLGRTVRGLPLLSLINRPREQFGIYLGFILALLAGRALCPWGTGRRSRVFGLVAWGLLIANTAYMGWNVRARLAYMVSGRSAPVAEWSDTYHLLERPSDPWRDHLCFLLQRNTGIQYWDARLIDRQRPHLVTSLVAADDGSHRPNPDFKGMVSFEDEENQAELKTFTPNVIKVHVTVRRPGVLTINQIADSNWRVSEEVLAHGHAGGSSLRGRLPRKAASPAPVREPLPGVLVPDVPLLTVRLDRVGQYEVRLRYVPSRLFVGLAVSVAAAVLGCVLLAWMSRSRRGRIR